LLKTADTTGLSFAGHYLARVFGIVSSIAAAPLTEFPADIG
jgi:hypothetical protein